MTLESAGSIHLGVTIGTDRRPRIRDVRYGRRHYNRQARHHRAYRRRVTIYIQYIGRSTSGLNKTRGLLRKRPAMMRSRKPSAPPYFIGPVSSVQWKGRARVN